MPDSLKIEVARQGDRQRIVVSGDLDMDSSPDLLEAIKETLAETTGDLEVDLADVGYVDSSGIAVLVHGYKLGRKENRQFVLRRPSQRLLSVLSLSQLTSFFTIEESG